MVNTVRLRRQRKLIYEREEGKCFWCDKWMRFPDSTRDHIITQSKGGMNTVNNLVLSCFSCNNERGDQPAEQFLMRKMA